MITSQNVSFCAGDTPTIQISITVSDGTVFNPTGASATWSLAALTPPASGAWTATLTKSTTSGGVSFGTDPSNNPCVNVTLQESDTNTLAAGKYYHECLIVESGGARSHVMTGQVTILATPNP